MSELVGGPRGRRGRRLPPTAVSAAAAMYFGRDPNINGRLIHNMSWANRQNNAAYTSDGIAIIIYCTAAFPFM